MPKKVERLRHGIAIACDVTSFKRRQKGGSENSIASDFCSVPAIAKISAAIVHHEGFMLIGVILIARLLLELSRCLKLLLLER